MAGSLAVKNGLRKAKPVLLEPIMELALVTPAQFMGEVIGDLNSRRGHVDGIETRGEISDIHSLIPLSDTFGYATALRSLTQGRANYSLQFNHYRVMPENLLDKVIGRVK